MSARSRSAWGDAARLSGVPHTGHITSSSMSGRLARCCAAIAVAGSSARSERGEDRRESSHAPTFSSAWSMNFWSTVPRLLATIRPSRSITNVSGSATVPYSLASLPSVSRMLG